MSALLTIVEVSKRFRGLVAVDRVSCDVMAGEMEVHHPFHPSRALRGQAVQVQLTDARAAAEPVLFAGRAPLLF